jgi:hypothetical protein
VVVGPLALLKMTVPGPLTFVHETAGAPAEGTPSSLTEPFKAAVEGRVMF